MRGMLVVGGGVLGFCTALALQDRGLSVSLLDEGPSVRPASWGNAGHIAVEQVEPLASPATLFGVPARLLARDDALSLPLRDVGHWLPFGVRLALASRPDRFAAGKLALKGLMADAMPAWERLVAGLARPDLLIRDGHYVIWDTAGSAARGMRRLQAGDHGTARFRALEPGEGAALAALLGRVPAGAVRCVGSGHIAGHDLLFDAMRDRFLGRGGVLLRGRAAGLPVAGGRAVVALEGGGELKPEGVIVAAGVASRTLMESVGHVVPMIAERGYHLQAEVGTWPAGLPPLVFEDRALIVTRFRDYLRASSFVEFSHQDSPPDAGKWERLRGRIRDLSLPFALPGAEWVGCRPTLPDYLPAIGRSGMAANLLYAFGHQHLGLTLGPVTAEIVAGLATGQGRGPGAFSVERFGATA
ncbi:NAD(P)/FAD-dependent oxidoreductase [Niveispirillum sp. KHB5.9]|uniref:NAD(P)/FAD-dependent oxidoreductase n=1 Tax=Niveispirillum sp. KHB5.9 TaxID=3400269 RepID=UPI003A853767